MPPEPLPWDRKDFFKERKHHNNHHNDRSSDSSLIGAAAGGSLARWRDYSSSSSHHGRDFPRWGSVDFRRPPGHGKQGGCPVFAEDSGHVYTPSRSSDKMLEDESSRMSVSRGDGKYSSRNSRENRGSFGQRDWKGHSWETSNGSSNTPVRLHEVNSDRSVDDVLTYPSHPQSDFVSTWDHIQLKDQNDNKMSGVNGLGTGQRCERENSLDWKPLKWTRSSSLSSRGSGFSHSSSSKSMGGVDSGEGKAELQPKSSTPVQSPSGDAVVCTISAAPSEETTSRKKPRLGWGEGLAKYEKKKVEGPDVSVSKDGVVVSPSNAEPVQCLSSTLAEKSPRVLGFSDCASPTTPSSVACSSSPGGDEKAFGKAANVDNDGNNLCGSPSIGSQNHAEGFLFNLEKLDISSVDNLGPSLIELLQSDDTALGDSSFVQSTAVNKLLIWKGNILKTLEVTESEIDSLESELKSLKSALGSGDPCPTASSSLSEDSNAKHFKEQEAASDLTTRPAPLKILSCGDAAAEKIPCCTNTMTEGHTNAKDDDIDSPGTATSKFVEPLSLGKAVSPSDMVKNDECPVELDAAHLTDIEVKCSVPDSCVVGTTGVPTCGNGSVLIEGKDGAPSSINFKVHAEKENMLCDIILGSNKESANRASEVFNKLLPSDQCNIDILRATSVLCSTSDSLIREKIAKRKQFLRFKERVLTLKFKAFQHLWKEDMRLLSVRKYRARSQKKCELNSRPTHSGYQKHRSSIRSRFSSPASGNLSLVPTTEVINFTSKLLSDSQVKVYRDPLKMPALILDKKDKMVSRFISSNGLVEDPCAVEKERSVINPWTSEEREIFLDKLATFGKDFRKIASFLDHKNTADCVEFYYKNHKSECFQKLKRHDFNKQEKSSTNTYMVTSGKKWNRKMNAASLDILGEASEMAAAAHADNGRQLFSGRIRGQCDSKMSLGDDSIIELSSSFDVFGSERETAAADVLAGICGSLSSEAMSSCITSSVDPGEAQREWKHQKLDSVVRRPSTSDVTQNVDDDTCSDESCGEMDPADWTDEEKCIFMQAFSTYGKDFAMISRCVRTRSRDQCKVFFSKARKCLGLDLIHTGGCGNVGISANDDTNGGGGSDTEDMCALETGSVICSEKLDSTMEGLPPSVVKIIQGESCPIRPLKTDLNKSVDDDRLGPLADKNSKAECVVSDVCLTQTRSEIVSELESYKMNGVDMQSDSGQPQKTKVVLTDTECGRDQVTEQGASIAASVSGGEAICPCPSSSNAVVDTKKVVGAASGKGFGSSFDRQGLVLTDDNLNDKRDKNCNAHSSGESEMMQDSNTIGNSFDLAVDTSSSSGFGFTPESLRVPLKLDPVDKSPVISFAQESSLTTATCVSQDSATALQLEKALNQDRLSSTLDLQESKVKSVHKSVGSNDYRQHLPENSVVNHVESSQILKGYPLQITNKKEVNGDASFRQLSEVQSNLKSDRNVGGPYLAQDCYLQKCNGSVPPSSIPELPFLSQSSEKTGNYPRNHSRGLSDAEKPCRNGDVKLFGKILSHPSSSPKPNAGAHENEAKGGTQHHKQSSKTSNISFSAHQPAHGGTTNLKFDRNNYLGLENVPVRSYGFWDGSRIQTGFTSMSDSAILLAKYPNAFATNYPASSSKMEQQTLHSVVNGNENGVAPREISGSNGVVDYQVYNRSRDSPKVQPFTVGTVDMKQRQELLFSEMQRRNGFESRSGLQQQGRGMVGVNVVGRGGILVGGPCNTGVTDPVAAIKRHFAKAAEQYGGQSGSMIREEESWRGKGDVGR